MNRNIAEIMTKHDPLKAENENLFELVRKQVISSHASHSLKASKVLVPG